MSCAGRVDGLVVFSFGQRARLDVILFKDTDPGYCRRNTIWRDDVLGHRPVDPPIPGAPEKQEESGRRLLTSEI